MKLKAFLALTLMGTLSATAQVTTDTVTTVENARRVVVTERDSVVNIDIFGNGTDPTFRYSYSKSVGKNSESVVRQSADDWDFNILFGKKKKKKEQEKSNKWQKELGILGLAMGWVATPGMPDGLKAKMSKSAEFYLDILNVNFQRHHHALAIHTGFYTASLCHEGKQLRYGKNASHGLAPEAYPAGSDPKFSRLFLTTNYLGFSYRYTFRHDWFVGLRTNLHYAWRAKVRSEYSLNGRDFMEKMKNIRTNRVSADIIGQVGKDFVSLYVKYNPCRILQDATGSDDSRRIAIGLSLGF